MPGTIRAIGAKLRGRALTVGATPTFAGDDDGTVAGALSAATVGTTAAGGVEVRESDLQGG